MLISFRRGCFKTLNILQPYKQLSDEASSQLIGVQKCIAGSRRELLCGCPTSGDSKLCLSIWVSKQSFWRRFASSIGSRVSSSGRNAGGFRTRPGAKRKSQNLSHPQANCMKSKKSFSLLCSVSRSARRSSRCSWRCSPESCLQKAASRTRVSFRESRRPPGTHCGHSVLSNLHSDMTLSIVRYL